MQFLENSDHAPLPGAGERRRHSRTPTMQPVELTTGHYSLMAAMVNLSESGVCIKLSSAEPSLHPKDTVTLSLIDKTEIQGQIVWISNNLIGIRFSVFFLSADDMLNFDHLGSEYFSRILQFQSKGRKS